MILSNDQPGNVNDSTMLVYFDEYEFLCHGRHFYIINNHNTRIMPKGVWELMCLWAYGLMSLWAYKMMCLCVYMLISL